MSYSFELNTVLISRYPRIIFQIIAEYKEVKVEVYLAALKRGKRDSQVAF
jgi:hypothetical protein